MFYCGVAVSMGEAAKPILCPGFMVLRHSHMHVSANVSKFIVCGKRNTFATFSRDEVSFRTLETSIVSLRGKRST